MMDWFDMFLVAGDVYCDYDDAQACADLWSQVALQQWREKQVWRMTTMLRASLNERPGKPGDVGRNQGQIRTVCEGLHELTFRRLKGSMKGLDKLLTAAEKSNEARDRWFDEALSPQLKKQVDLLVKMAA